MSPDEESKRVSMQVSSLSTQLIESIEKQSKLEEQLLQIKRENDQLRVQAKDTDELRSGYQTLQAQYEEILQHNNSMGKKLELETKEKLDAKEEVSKLQAEVQELSESLFSEANNMVSDARRETSAISRRNDSLISQLQEKDVLLENLQSQLEQLKEALHERDEESLLSRRNSVDDTKFRQLTKTPSNSSSQLNIPLLPQQAIIYSPATDSLRFDLEHYAEYKRFTKCLPSVESIRHTDTKFLKRLIADDVEPALRIENAPGVSWLTKRSLMTSIIEGRVAIEPISGINETYRLNSQHHRSAESDIKSNLYSYPADSPPVAVDEPCSLCGEERNDILEHSRLYVMKVHPKNDSSSTANLANNITATTHYPLCSFCLFRMRSTSELFAFLRSLKTDAWRLDNEETIKKSWVELSRLRSKLFWSKIGSWDLESSVFTTHITPSSDQKLVDKRAGVKDKRNLKGFSASNDLERRGTPLRAEVRLEDLEHTAGTTTVVSPTSHHHKASIDEDLPVESYDGSTVDIIEDLTKTESSEAENNGEMEIEEEKITPELKKDETKSEKQENNNETKDDHVNPLDGPIDGDVAVKEF